MVFRHLARVHCLRARAFGFPLGSCPSSHPLRYDTPFQLVSPPLGLSSKVRNPLSFRTFASIRSLVQSKASSKADPLHVEEQLSDVLSTAEALAQSTSPLGENASHAALQDCERLAETLARVEVNENTESPASSLLDLEELQRPSESPTLNLTRPMLDRITEQVSKAAYDIVTSPQVFITPLLLAKYVDTQALLGRPDTIPSIFLLYASKPVPRAKTSPIEYTASNPSKASSAVPLSTASNALDAAIDAKNLPICLDVINTTVCASAFRRAKFVRRALIPILGAAMAPAAAYSAASQWAAWQDTLDSQMARNIVFAGLLAYVSFTGTIGVVAATTSNDQMDRVTWASGTPLRERWLREEERAMVDRVACAWGFHESWKRGEEEGPEWQKLREWAGLRGMVVDKVELMEGME